MKITRRWLLENEACREAVYYLIFNNLIGMDAIELLQKLKDTRPDFCVWGIGVCTNITILRQAIIIFDINSHDGLWRTPLMWACIYNHLKTAKFLLEHGADVDRVDCAGATALRWAKNNQNKKLITLLKKHGAKS